MHLRTLVGLLLLAVATACAANEPPVADLEPRLLGTPIEPRPEPEQLAQAEPEMTLEERWRAPFAVQSIGRPASRPAPVAVTVDSREPTAPAAPQAVAEAGTTPPAVVPTAAPARPAPAATPPAATPPAAAPPAAPTRTTTPATTQPGAGRAPAATTVAGSRTHRVEWGDTWLGIARRYSVTSSALAAANPDVDPERIRTGQVLRVPGADPALRSGQRSHVVGPGDSLWGIARRYGVTTEQIRSANRLPDDQVRLGQTLIIPPVETAR
jgi:LysM repeat protein